MNARARAWVGGTVLGLFVLLAIAGPWWVGDASEPVALPLHAPSWEHPLGTTGSGQDVMSQLVAGARSTVLAALGIGLLAAAIGVLLGVLAGAAGGLVDAALSLVIDVFLVIPGLPLLVVMGAYLGGGQLEVSLVLALTGWAWTARVLRAETLALRTRDFVLAAEALGESRAYIAIFELLPNLWPLAASCLAGAVTYALGALVGLEFLGLLPVDRVSWGTMLYWARNDAALITGSWWTFVPAGLAIGFLGSALAVLASAADEIGNPRLRIGREYRLRAGRPANAGAATVVLEGKGSPASAGSAGTAGSSGHG